jgi:hypothetical protein
VLVLLLGRIGRVAAVLGRHLRSAVARARVLALRMLLIGGRVALLMTVLGWRLAILWLAVAMLLL